MFFIVLSFVAVAIAATVWLTRDKPKLALDHHTVELAERAATVHNALGGMTTTHQVLRSWGYDV